MLLAVAFAIGCLLVLVDVADASPYTRARAAVCQVFTPCAPAMRVVRCETGGTYDARARGGAGERGLFQIHPVHFGWVDERRLYEPLYNARIAYRLSRGGTSWRAWTCRP